ncbi:hypothetical protein KM043_018838 [Ampulex compressa]|nr:hypothetical protein KM043_018838 [Ampulex compressa]
MKGEGGCVEKGDGGDDVLAVEETREKLERIMARARVDSDHMTLTVKRGGAGWREIGRKMGDKEEWEGLGGGGKESEGSEWADKGKEKGKMARVDRGASGTERSWKCVGKR